MQDTQLDVSLDTHPNVIDLKQSIANAVQDLIPPDHKGAVIMVASQTGMTFGVATKIGKDWQIAGDVTKKWDSGDVSGRVMVMGSW